jgi:CelD/BcsL family acetyltransferase involved in cellulose biosynthesis
VLGASGVVIAIASDAVFRVAIGPAARRLDEQALALDVLGRENPPALIADRVPWLKATGRCGLAAWSLERRLCGHRPPPVFDGPLLRESLEFLVALHAVGTSSVSGDHPRSHASAVAGVIGGPLGHTLLDAAESVHHRLQGVPRGFSHGDFWSGNLLAKSDRLLGVVDWPAAATGALPILDLLHLEVSSIRERTHGQLGDVLASVLLPRVRGGPPEVYRLYCQRLGLELDRDHWLALMTAYWIQALEHELFDPDRDSNYAESPRWVDLNVKVVVDALQRLEHSTTKSISSRAWASGTLAHDGNPSAELVTNATVLESVADEWRAMAERLGNPFVTPDWFFASLRHSPENTTPFVPVVRYDDERLAGVVPLVAEGTRMFRAIRFPRAEWGHYFEPVADGAEAQADVTRSTIRTLSSRQCKWGIWVVDYAKEGSQWLSALAQSPRVWRTEYHSRSTLFRYMDLEGHDWNAFLSSLSPTLRSQLETKLRDLSRSHDVRFRRTLDPDHLAEDMERFFRLHDLRWSRGWGPFLADNETRAFHRDFAACALDRGWLRLWSLDVDGEAIAAWYGWHIGRRYLYYHAGFDPRWAHYSPGLLMVAHTIRAAIDEDAAKYELPVGNDPYEIRLAQEVRAARTVVVTRPAHPARAAVAFDVGMRRVIRALPPDVRRRLRTGAAPWLQRWPVNTGP